MRTDQTQPDEPAPRWISIEEAGALFGVKKAQAHIWAKAGIIPTLQVSPRRWLVPLSALDALEDAVIEQARQVASRQEPETPSRVPLRLAPRASRRGRKA